MKYISMFSGIEAASAAWDVLGFEPVAFSEIEPFPKAVLAKHYPDVPDLGDMTKVDWHQYEGKADIVVGGPPCQAFSIAGLRKGIADPRGNLTLEYMRAISCIQPEFLIFENVPGILSDKTHAFESFVLGLNELGYLLDMDILDAQFFGVAQRRTRVFVVGWNVKKLLSKHNDKSRTVLAQLTAELSRLSLNAMYLQTDGSGVIDGKNADDTRDAISKRLKLFGLSSPEKLRAVLEDVAGSPDALRDTVRSVLTGLASSTRAAMGIRNTGVPDFVKALWRSLDDAANGAGISADENASNVYVSSVASIIVSKLSEGLMLDHSHLLYGMRDAVNESTERVMEYERQKNATGDLFAQPDASFTDISGEAREYQESFTGSGTEWERRPEVLSERESVRWDSTPSREKRAAIASRSAIRSDSTVDQGENSGGTTGVTSDQVATQYGDELAGTLTARADSSPCVDRGQNIVYPLNVDDGDSCLTPWDYQSSRVYKDHGVYPTLSARPDGSGTNGQAVLTDDDHDTHVSAFLWNAGERAQSIGYDDELSPTLKTSHNPAVLCRDDDGTDNGVYQIAGNVIGRQPENGGNGKGYCNPADDGAYTLTATDKFAVAFTQNQRDEVRDLNDCAGALAAQPGVKQQTYVYCASDSGTNASVEREMAPTLTAHDAKSASYVFASQNSPSANLSISKVVAPTLQTSKVSAVSGNGVVRRLTPMECERLQGFPDGYTDDIFPVTTHSVEHWKHVLQYWDGLKPESKQRTTPWTDAQVEKWMSKGETSDGPRYKALGNSMCVLVMRWIGSQLDAVR